MIAQAFDQSKIDSEDRFSTEELIADLKASGKSAQVFPGADSIVTELVQKSKSGDLILIMSNGGFDNIYAKLLKALTH